MTLARETLLVWDIRPSLGHMAEWTYRLGFDSESGQTNDFKIGIHSFPA